MNKSIQTKHGDIKLPAFLPDATYGTIKGLTWNDVTSTNTNSVVTTTLHLEQKIGSAYLKEYGGIHKFFGWNKPILTDSGGFQVFTLIYRNPGKQNAITDAGCTFIDYDSGDYQFLSPEISQIVQFNLGSDIVTVLDVPIKHDASTSELAESIKRNTDWARRSKVKFLELNKLTENDFNNPKIQRPLIGAVIQGGNNTDLRRQSAEELREIGFDLYNYGGAPIHNDKHWHSDAPKGFNREMLEYVSSLIPDNKIKYAMGVGSPDDILYSIEKGWDIFDTVLPTRNARHGYLYVSKGQGDNEEHPTTKEKFENYDVLHIKSDRYKFAEEQVDAKCNCECCKSVSRAYLRHLLRIGDTSGQRLASIHNLTFYQKIIASKHL